MLDVAHIDVNTTHVIERSARRLDRRLHVLAYLPRLLGDVADPGDRSIRAPCGHAGNKDQPAFGPTTAAANTPTGFLIASDEISRLGMFAFLRVGASTEWCGRDAELAREPRQHLGNRGGELDLAAALSRRRHSGSPGANSASATPGARRPDRMRSAAASARMRKSSRSQKCATSMAMNRCEQS